MAAIYPADTFREGVDLTIVASNQLAQVVRGDANTEVTVEDGSTIPSIRKAQADSMYFKEPEAWTTGQTETDYLQLKKYIDPATNKESWWFAKGALVSNPIAMGTSPFGDDNWTLYTPEDLFISGKAEYESVYQALKGKAAEAGYNLVRGSFEEGGTLTNTKDVLWYQATGRYYNWYNGSAKTVLAGSTPATSGGVGTGGWIDRSDVSLRAEITPSVTEALRRSYADTGLNLVAGSFNAGGTLVNATDVMLYEANGKAYSWGGVLPKTVPAGSTPSSSGGISASAWIDRSLNKAREAVSVKAFGAVGDGVADDTEAIQNAINYIGTNGTVFFPDGEYRVSSTLRLSNDQVLLQGELNARIKRYGAFEILQINGSYNKVSNLQFMGNKDTYPFPSFSRAALVLVTGDFNIISDNQIEDGNSHGILFRTAGVPQFNLVEGNIVLNCEEVGIAHDGGVDNRILGNHVSGCGFEGITLDQTSVRCIVDGNRLNANCQSGGVGSIGIDWTDLCVISNNVITASGTLSGITFQNNLGPSNRNVISGNVFVDNLAYGVWLKNNTGGTCNDNVITGNMFGASGSIKIDSNCQRNILSGNSYAAFPDVHPDSYCRVDNALVNFYVQNTVTRSNVTGDGTAYKVPYNTIIQDRNIESTSSFNTSTGVFTAPITANYTFSAGVLTQSSLGGLADSVLVEIVTSAGTFTQTFSATDQDVFGGSVTASFFLKRGETAFVRVIVFGGYKTYSVTDDINANYFTGVLVG